MISFRNLKCHQTMNPFLDFDLSEIRVPLHRFCVVQKNKIAIPQVSKNIIFQTK